MPWWRPLINKVISKLFWCQLGLYRIFGLPISEPQCSHVSRGNASPSLSPSAWENRSDQRIEHEVSESKRERKWPRENITRKSVSLHLHRLWDRSDV
uniref:Secreted protein n=1 Tax=Steinernema glaseri TaxID=37863 RepID=A0A1I7YGL5_9BILA